MCQSLSGQISVEAEPLSFSIKDFDTETIPVIVMPTFDLNALVQENKNESDNKSIKPFRFGFAIDVDIDIKRDGMRKELTDGGNLWLLKIHSPEAFSINLIYNQFRLGEGSLFFVYNMNKTMVLGAFTPEVNNNRSNEFATDLVQGNTIVLEYYEPFNDGVLRINKVIHGYIDMFSDYSNGLGTSANCNIDVNCSLGNYWGNEKRAVSMILIDDNTAYCTGCLVNNTQQDFRPFYLTAYHCIIDTYPTNNPATSIFRFRYWRPGCNSGGPSNWKSITGASMMANYQSSDMILLELGARPTSDFNAYFAGWDRTSTPAQEATGIHHPKGDAMKICYTQNPVTAVSWLGSPQQTHWRATFTQGIVQHGSSGSPLFNQNKRIVGQLHGYQYNQCYSWDNVCFCSQTPVGEYGRFDISWTGGGTNSTRLSNWLDPINSNVTYLDGKNQPTITGDGSIFPCKIYQYGISNPPSSYSWGYSSNISIVETGYGYAKIIAYSTGVGYLTLKNSSGVEITRLYINVSCAAHPVVCRIEGPTDVAPDGTFHRYEAYTDCVSPTNYQWEVYGAPSSWYSIIPYGSSADIAFYGSATYSVYVTASNSSGFDQEQLFVEAYQRGGHISPFTVYPNPVDNVLNIDIDQQAILDQYAAAGKAAVNPTCEIYLYNVFSIPFYKTTTTGNNVQINVSHLPKGYYFLQLYDGISNKPEMKQIIKN